MISNIFHSFQTLSSSLRISKTVFSAEIGSDADVSELTTGTSTMDSVLQILGLLVLFILIIIVAYFATRWIGNLSAVGFSNKNISVIETFKISTTKYIQIIKVTDKYFVIGVSKDDITYMGEIDPEKLVDKSEGSDIKNFKEMFETTLSKYKKSKK